MLKPALGSGVGVDVEVGSGLGVIVAVGSVVAVADGGRGLTVGVADGAAPVHPLRNRQNTSMAR
jgi:hypothetical protein